MADAEAGTSRWDRLAQRRYRLPAVVLLFGAWLAPKFLPLGSPAREVTTLGPVPTAVGAAVVLIGPKLHRSFASTRQDARVDPTGRLRREAAERKTASDESAPVASPDSRSRDGRFPDAHA